MKVVLLFIASLVAAASSAEFKSAGEVFCKPNRNFELECNDCLCAPDGRNYKCSERKCELRDHYLIKYSSAHGSDDKVYKKCLPGQVKPRYCQKCTCTEDGESYACSNVICDFSLWNEDGSLKSGRCEPNKLSYQKDAGQCKICLCDSKGLRSQCNPTACNSAFYDKQAAVGGVVYSSYDFSQLTDN